MLRQSSTIAITLMLAAATLAGCSRSEDTAKSDTSATGTAPSWLLTAAPDGAVEIAAAKQSAAEGDQIVLRGRIGGRRDAMSADSATFVMMDTGIPSCADDPDETCSTPWDYCCEPKEVKEANNATVQLVDGTGAAVTADLTSLGIEPLDEVVVIGTVAPRPTQGILIIHAKGIHRVGG
jgi:hypothetical protein